MKKSSPSEMLASAKRVSLQEGNRRKTQADLAKEYIDTIIHLRLEKFLSCDKISAFLLKKGVKINSSEIWKVLKEAEGTAE